MKGFEFNVTKQNGMTLVQYQLGAADAYDDRVADKVAQLGNIIPFQYKDEDGKRSITSYVHDDTTLEVILKRTLKKPEVLAIIKGLLCAFEIGAAGVQISYLVRDTNYIYVDPERFTVKCIMVPVKQGALSQSEIPEFFRNIVSRMRFDDADKDNYAAQLLTLINTDNYSNMKLKELVDSLMESIGLFYTKEEGIRKNADTQSPEMPNKDVRVNRVGVMNNMRPQGMPQMQNPQGMMPQGMPRMQNPQGMMPQGMPQMQNPQGMMPQGMPQMQNPQGMPQGMPQMQNPQGMMPQGMPQMQNPQGMPQPMPQPTPIPEAPKPVPEPVPMPEAPKPMPQPTPVPEAPKPMPQPTPVPEAPKPVPQPIPVPEAPKPMPQPTPVPEAPKPMPQPTPVPEAPKPQPGSMLMQGMMGGNGGLVGQLGTRPTPHFVRKATGEIINITKPEFVIGKSKTKADYAIENNSAISREHCIVVQRDGVNYIKDNNSTNHTYVNGVELQPGKEVLLKHKTEVRMGDEEFTFLLRKGD